MRAHVHNLDRMLDQKVVKVVNIAVNIKYIMLPGWILKLYGGCISALEVANIHPHSSPGNGLFCSFSMVGGLGSSWFLGGGVCQETLTPGASSHSFVSVLAELTASHHAIVPVLLQAIT